MKKLLTIGCAALACLAPAAASAKDHPANPHPPKTNAAKFCKQLAAASGGKHSETYASAVRALFPDARHVTAKNAYGKCVSAKRKEKQTDATQAQDERTLNAAQTCKAQRKDDAAGFATQWGTRRNAFGKCVSATAKKDQQS
jgi:hypothetical protein